jgi:hypothetical protein
MSREPLRIIVTGLIGQYPLGGVAWDYIQYVLGLRQLGHDVYYFEDTGQSPYVPPLGGLSDDWSYTVSYLKKLMARFGLEDRWAYRFPYPVAQWFGLSDRARMEVISTADLLINVSGTLARPQDYREASRLVFLDSDPAFTQVKLARGQKDFEALVDLHDVHFSFGETLPGNVPDTGHNWLPTRQPVVLPLWKNQSDFRNVFTTVMNWTSYNPIEFAGASYGQKNEEFTRFLDLPSAVAPTQLEIAVNEGKTKRTPRDLLTFKGWNVVDPSVVCPDLDSYRSYISSSMAEWSIAKNGYVVGQCGWFSCRSACYLAAGRPVVVQETGFSEVLPTGAGLLSFSNEDEAISSVQEVVGNYERHAQAAFEIAETYFDANAILSDLINRC